MTAALDHVFQSSIASRLFNTRQYKFDLYANMGASGQTQQSVEVPLEVKNSTIVCGLYHIVNMDHVEDCYQLMRDIRDGVPCADPHIDKEPLFRRKMS